MVARRLPMHINQSCACGHALFAFDGTTREEHRKSEDPTIYLAKDLCRHLDLAWFYRQGLEPACLVDKTQRIYYL